MGATDTTTDTTTETTTETTTKTNYLTTAEMVARWRPMTPEEISRASVLITTVCSSLRVEANKVNMDLDALVEADEDLMEVAKQVVCDVVARSILTSTSQEPLTQFSQTAGGYTVSGTYANAGGGLFIKKSDLAKLGIKRQRFGGVNVYSWD